MQENSLGLISEEYEKSVKAFALSDERQPYYKFSSSNFKEDIKEKKGYVYYDQVALVFVYCFEKQIYAPKSILECRVRFLEDHTAFEYPFYDVLSIINPNDFKCYLFPYIECAERMRECFSYLSDAVKRYLPDIFAIAEDEKKLDLLKTEHLENLRAKFGRFYDTAVENDGEFFEENYYLLYHLAFATDAYNCFLKGEYEKAKKKYLRSKNLFAYEKRLLAFLQSLPPGEKYEAVPPELNTLNDGLKEANKGSGSGIMLFSVFCFSPVLAAVFTSVYLLIVKLVYQNALYVTNLDMSSAFEMMLPAIFASMLLSFYLRERIVRLIYRKSYQKRIQYDSILNRKHEERVMRRLTYVVVTGCLIFLFLSVNNNLVFYEDGFRNNLKFFSLESEYIKYDSIDSVWEISGRENSFGMWIDSRYYIILLKNGRKLDFSYDVPEYQFEERIVPLLAEKGVKTCNAVTEDEVKLTE